MTTGTTKALSQGPLDPGCATIRGRLAEAGPAALRDDARARRHIAECDACYDFLEALSTLETTFAQLEAIEAPDALVDAVLEKVRESTPRDGASAAVAAPAATTWGGRLRQRFAARRSTARDSAKPLASSNDRRWWGVAAVLASGVVAWGILVPRLAPSGRQVSPESVRVVIGQDDSELPHTAAGQPEPKSKAVADGNERLSGVSPGSLELSSRVVAEGEPAIVESRRRNTPSVAPPTAPIGGKGRADLTAEYGRAKTEETLAFDKGIVKENGIEENGIEEKGIEESEEDPLGAEKSPREAATDEAREAARALLAERARIEGVPVQEAAGYWANTYVPGDPVFRLLHSRLLGADLADPATPAPHQQARPPVRPFDPPTQSALAVYLQADHSHLDGPARTLLQVGLQATERHSGRRPALELVLVLDLRGEIAPDQATTLRALVSALNERRDLDDRFRLVIAGRPGGLVVSAEDFRHGPLTLALDQALGLGGGTPGLDLPQAMTRAYELLAESEEPGSTLGTSLVLLATTQPLGAALDRLERLAHQATTAGATTSVVGVGEAIDRGELDRLALAGQGTQRLLASSLEATGLVDRELAAVSRVVARALRLRIRLAPGVELVDVLGSERLDAARAEAVREAEQSVDLRLARDFGITTDRGEDEEGIQIIIPTFQAGDSHVVLLDVIAPGPGPLADVTVRYKDLVHLRNGVTRDHLTLRRGEPQAGPLQLGVFESLLAYRLFETLERAGLDLANGHPQAARQGLWDALVERRGLRHELPGLTHAPDLVADIELLERYLGLLASEDPEHTPPTLTDSLRLAARLQILPRPTIER